MQNICCSSLLAGCGLVVAAILIGGCATTSSEVQPSPTDEVIAPRDQTDPELIPVIRYGRYTLVELSPGSAQRDLLLQVIDVRMPDEARASVGDGLRHVLNRSGYQMCETGSAALELYPLPMPAAHLQLGPMTLRDALLTLAGPAWDVEVNDSTRQVCFVRPGTHVELPSQYLRSSGPAQVFPQAGAQQ
ncbi:PilL N-terminal domain-containing protein [Xanthomonas euvesicatoria]|uniref:PFGI-1 class ICE element type IV pilus protein PilL2 n=1 Tax=Xanthomonas euvesicatoria TaxID=456327 RepID=UPI000F8C844D